MKFLIADDHWVVRQTLRQILKRRFGEATVLEAADFDETLKTIESHPDIDLMLFDLVMPGCDGFDGLTTLRARFPDVPIAVITAHDEIDYVIRCLAMGVIGYISKSAEGAEVELAIERVLAGEVFVPRDIIVRASGPLVPTPRPEAPTSVPAPSSTHVTARERTILSLLGEGFSVKKIAAELQLSDHTVRVHLANLMKKLSLPDRSLLIHYAVENRAAFADAMAEAAGRS